MRKKLLFVALCLMTTVPFGYGQAQTKKSGKTTGLVVSSNSDLSAQKAKLEAKEQQIKEAVNSSRAVVGQLNEEFRILKEEYLQMLSVELEKTTDSQLITQLKEEVARYSQTTNSQTR
ncbi:hypothetical protein [Fluviicola sp.]|uniref:hypothetical protein n=1 Tax=Fluviicola sp. TaxID=1917219 RepID=UPI002632D6A5|nr:hypothetical protein [Fluviicola sp.]